MFTYSSASFLANQAAETFKVFLGSVVCKFLKPSAALQPTTKEFQSVKVKFYDDLAVELKIHMHSMWHSHIAVFNCGKAL